MTKLLKTGFILIVLIVLNACGTSKYCIDADDFGFFKLAISANGQNVQGQEENEYTDWEDYALELNGDPLLIVVRGNGQENNDYNSEWTSWMCDNQSTVQDCSFIFYNLYESCNFGSVGDCGPYCSPNSTSKYATIPNAPCVFRQGLGLYGLAVSPAATNGPNDSYYTKTNPVGYIMPTVSAWTFHLGDERDLQNGTETDLGGYSSELSATLPTNMTQYTNWKLYFKVLDNYYTDNAGQYNMIIKSGVSSTNSSPFETITNYITSTISNAVQSMFQNLLQESAFISDIRSTLVLFLTLTAVGWLMGYIPLNQTEMFVRLIKFGMVIELISDPNAWNFYNDYFFNFFTNGVMSLVSIIVGFVSNGQVTGFNFFDSMIYIFFSTETTTKIWSLFTANFGVALFTIPIIYIAILLFVVGLIKGFIYYLTAYIATSILIIIFPIFLVMMLFDMTKNIYDTWLKNIISYFVEVLFIFAALGIMAQVIISQLYMTLGYPVCWQPMISLSSSIKLFYFWIPTINAKSSDTTSIANGATTNGSTFGEILIPGYTIQNASSVTAYDGASVYAMSGDQVTQWYCPPYTCQGVRIYDLPFLDPIANQSLADSLISGGSGWWQVFIQSLILLLSAYILLKFYDIVPPMARAIAGTDANAFSLQNRTNATLKNIKGGIGIAGDLANSATKGKVKDAYNKLKGKVTKRLNAFQDAVGGTIDKAKDKINPMSGIQKGAKEFDDRLNLKKQLLKAIEGGAGTGKAGDEPKDSKDHKTKEAGDKSKDSKDPKTKEADDKSAVLKPEISYTRNPKKTGGLDPIEEKHGKEARNEAGRILQKMGKEQADDMKPKSEEKKADHMSKLTEKDKENVARKTPSSNKSISTSKDPNAVTSSSQSTKHEKGDQHKEAKPVNSKPTQDRSSLLKEIKENKEAKDRRKGIPKI